MLNFDCVFPSCNFKCNNVEEVEFLKHLKEEHSDELLKISKKENVRVAFSINNLLNTSYRENLNRLRYFADEIGRNFSIQLIYNY